MTDCDVQISPLAHITCTYNWLHGILYYFLASLSRCSSQQILLGASNILIVLYILYLSLFSIIVFFDCVYFLLLKSYSKCLCLWWIKIFNKKAATVFSAIHIAPLFVRSYVHVFRIFCSRALQFAVARCLTTLWGIKHTPKYFCA